MTKWLTHKLTNLYEDKTLTLLSQVAGICTTNYEYV